MMEWHRREEKSSWWEYFRLCDLSDSELQQESAAIGGLTYVGVAQQIELANAFYRYLELAQEIR